MNFSDRVARLLSPHRDPAAPGALTAPPAATSIALRPSAPIAPPIAPPAAMAPPQESAAAAAISNTTITATPSLQAVLRDPTLYVSQERWFKLLQDTGREMTEIEAVTYPPDGRKVKTRNINHGLWFYPELYQLAEEIFKLLDAKRDIHFQQLPKERNKTATIHQIGKAIASRCMYYKRTDLHDKQGFDDFIRSAGYDMRQVRDFTFSHKQ